MKWGISKKKNFVPSKDSIKTNTDAETILEQATETLKNATRIAKIIREEHEKNHFRERYIEALKGTKTS